MPSKKDAIVDFVQSQADRPMKVKELARALGVPSSDYAGFRKTVKELLDEGRLVRLKRGRVGPPEQLNVLVGQISVTRSGAGFLLREGDEDILIPAHKLLTAMDGDKVMVRLKGQRYGREAGTVIKVLERAQRNIVGIFRKDRHFNFVVPDNPRIHREIIIPVDYSLKAKDGERVVVQMMDWTDPYRNPEGRILERLGMPTDPGVDMLTIIKSYGFPEKFSPEVLDEAELASARLSEGDFSERLDLTRDCIYTIDPSDAKDHDDAVSVDRTATGYRLGVHIADVSHFVEPGTALDTEAFERGNSVYLPGMVIPMLPEVLSNDVCSLKPNRKRLAHTVFIDFEKSGKMVRWELADSVIKSRAKLAYEEVQDFFDGKEVPDRVSRVSESLSLARELAQRLSQRRFEQGSLDFDLPEAKIIMNDRGEVLELGHRIRLESHRLVEEFMLAANKAVALEVFRRAQPFLYRVHDKPDLEKLEAFSDMMRRLGYNFPVSATMHPQQFGRFLKEIADAPEADFINELMLRSMQKAVYQRENIGHFGLAFSHYTHFTSPIRRYPDLLVHRLLRKLRETGHYPAAFAKKVSSVIDNVGRHCSDTERVAESAERDAVKAKQVAYMAKHLGEEYHGVISGVTNYGFFVRLDQMGVEGLVKVSTIDDDFYAFEEKNYRLIGRRKRRTFRMGDAVEVGVMAVDRIRNEIDLFLLEDKTRATGPRLPGKPGNQKARGRKGKRRTTGKKRRKSNAK